MKWAFLWASTVLAIVGGLGQIASAEEVPKEALRHGKICIGTNGRMSVPSNREHHYQNLRDRYTNCTYVDGNLELTWLQDENLDLSFLQHIREVTGYVLISHVDVTKIILPSLQIIRGRTLFKLSVHEDEFALIVTLSKMHNLELPALRDILDGNVGILNNYNLCHIKSINWDEIITGQNAKKLYVYKFKERERDCTPCHESCQGGCWGDGENNCQKFSKINCSPQCHQGRCFGSQPRDCCHLFCAGGCTGPKASDCLACRNFYDDGVCKQECPPMQRYNPIKYKWEKNPDGKYAYGATCVRDCPKHLLKDNGACVRVCPPDKKTLNGECVPCNGPCPKTCHFSGTVHAGNIDSLKNCTVLEGSITILDSSFDGYQDIYENFTFGPRYPAMDPVKLEVLTSLHEITGYLNIQAHHENFTNLEAFRNLEIIGGRTLTEYFSSLYIVKSSLTSLAMRGLRKIRSGSVAILENKDLCYAEKINWQKIMKSTSHNTLLQNNRPTQTCILESKICDAQCSNDGCWGPGKGMCIACKNYAVENECVASCDPNLGLYKASERSCMKCDPECKMTCTGSGPGLCDECKHTKDGPFCVKECPDGKYDHNGECQPCHKNCIGGCKGPENTVGPQGCNSCDKVIISSDKNVDRCLNSNEECPQGHYLEWLSPQASKSFQALDLEGKPVCRQCHPLCKRCTGFGFHKEVCLECRHFEQDEQCTQECSADHYATSNNTCLPCHSECNGCQGPSADDCLACKHFKVFTGEVSKEGNESFFCTEKCEETDFPHAVYANENFCSAYASEETPLQANVSAIGGGIAAVAILFVVLFAVFIHQYRRRAMAKEQVSKMALAMTGYDDHEPLRPTNISPNLAQLNVVKESALRRHDHPLGCGAFGTVFRGFWEPEDKNCKVPVAIKVLNDETRADQSSILDEAKIMASLDNPHLLPLLAICMTSQLMLVTPLMPLGCLLDYVRKNKEKIGSKPLLNWCTQIAKGMSYLEERRLVHRDLAARNVLVQNPACVKITDFGLAKFLDYNEVEYNAQGGRMPIKWLAIECIRNKVFTHKSDVWAYGVTVWELLTYGEKPYGNNRAEEVPDLLEKGERLPQPQATGCSIEVYMLLIKCWMVDAESRPSFKELVTEFARMARDPARYLCIKGDKLMRLPSYTKQDEREDIRIMGQNLEIGDLERIMAAEEYLNPHGKMASQNTLHTPVDTPLPPPTPTQKFFSDGFTLPGHQASHRNSTMIHSNRQSRYGSSVQITDNGFSTLGSRGLRHSTMYSSENPLKALEDAHDGMPSSLDTHTQNTLSQRSHYPRPPTQMPNLPVDEAGYLEPSPRSPIFKTDNTTPTNNNAYMHLLSEDNTMFPYPPPQQLQQHCTTSNYGRVPDAINMGAPLASIDNLEYILTSRQSSSHGRGNYHELGIPFAGSANNGSPASSQGPASIHSVTSNPPHSGKPPSLTSNGSSSGRSAGLNGVLYNKKAELDSGSHEYYNDLAQMHREVKQFKLQPPPATAPKHETTV